MTRESVPAWRAMCLCGVFVAQHTLPPYGNPRKAPWAYVGSDGVTLDTPLFNYRMALLLLRLFTDIASTAGSGDAA